MVETPGSHFKWGVNKPRPKKNTPENSGETTWNFLWVNIRRLCDSSNRGGGNNCQPPTLKNQNPKYKLYSPSVVSPSPSPDATGTRLATLPGRRGGLRGRWGRGAGGHLPLGRGPSPPPPAGPNPLRPLRPPTPPGTSVGCRSASLICYHRQSRSFLDPSASQMVALSMVKNTW